MEYNVEDVEGSVEVKIHCVKDSTKPKFSMTKGKRNDDKPMITITGEAEEACPLFSLSYFYNKYPVPFSIAFIGAGLIIAFLGYRIFNVVLFLMATFVVAFILFNLIYQIAASSITMENFGVLWIIVGAAGIVGAIVGFFAVKFQKYCFFLAGACLGGIIGFIIYTAFLTSAKGAVFCCY